MMNLSGIPVWKEFGYQPPPSLKGETEQLETLIVGGGPVGLAMALDLGRRGRRVVVVNAMPFIARGSKGICYSKRSLEILDRLGVGERLLEKGVTWEKGKVFWKADAEPLYEFDLLPLKDQKFPAFINIQQYYVEEYLLDEIAKYDNIDVRWGAEVIGVEPQEGSVRVRIETKTGEYDIETSWLLACDGNKSSVRGMLGLDFEGRIFEDNFLIADVKFKDQRPTERWFRFNPPYPGWSSLIHQQPDDVWRLDFQLGWDIDRKEAVKPENVEPFVRGMLGPDVDFEYDWISVYTFQCRRMARFVHDRVIFAGDSAHLVSPFGARGCNGGFADIDNLGWKLDLVLDGKAPSSLLETYNTEATLTADENILNSTRSTDFITPKTKVSKVFRDAVLELATEYAFARPFVNSGRLSTPVSYADSDLNSPSSQEAFQSGVAPGSPCTDAPVNSVSGEDWLLSHLGEKFKVVIFSDDDAACEALHSTVSQDIDVIQMASRGEANGDRLVDHKGLVRERYGAEEGTAYLIRPDQYVAGRWRKPDTADLVNALHQATGTA